MAASSEHDIGVALDALQTDSVVWQAAVESCQQAQDRVAAITITATQFSYLADEFVGITRTCAQIQQRVGALLGGAGANFTEIAHALLTTQQTYQQNEQKIASSFHDLHE